MNNTISPAQAAYLRSCRKRKRRILMAQLALFFLFLGIWELTADTGLLNDFIFSSPSRLAKTFWAMTRDGSIFFHTGVTLAETIVSFLLVTVIGISGAMLLWLFPAAAGVLEPFLIMLNSLPKSALAPVLIVWLGSNVKTIVVAAVSVAVFGSVMTLHTGFQSMDPDKVKLIYTLGGTKRDVLGKGTAPRRCASADQQHEGQHRTLPGGGHHRRIPCCRQRARISHHLRKPGIQAGSGDFKHCDPLRTVHGLLPADHAAGETTLTHRFAVPKRRAFRSAGSPPFVFRFLFYSAMITPPSPA